MQPLLIPVVRDATKCIPLDLKKFSPKKTPFILRRDFENAIFKGMQVVRNTKPDLFKKIEDALAGKFNDVLEKRNAQASHQAFLVRSFTQVPIFGQEQTGVTISDLYVEQRCLWRSIEFQSGSVPLDDRQGQSEDHERAYFRDHKKSIVRRLQVGRLHEEAKVWLDLKDSNDAIRVVAGGPGSGKSTFARALAIRSIDQHDYDVLFVPLQDIPPTGSFEQRIEALYHTRSELGFDRVDSPLKWLGRARPDGQAPLKPILLICDGLDEIAPPDTREAVNATLEFINALSSWISARNSGGCFAKCVILGRDGAAEEAFRKLNIDSEKLLYVGGLRPLSSRDDWKSHNLDKTLDDPSNMSGGDQRVEYWAKWARFFGLDENKIPAALQPSAESEAALQELTAEPLLLYLLLWTGYLDIKWREAAENRNVVYQEIFNRIYRRDWGHLQRTRSSANRVVGGHTTTADLTPEEFMALQEALGLAAWPSGGRIVSKTSFERTIKYYLSEDQYDDFKNNEGISLKSVALHSYTRSSESEESGYEFVHKSLGEYLIGRALVELNLKALALLGNRVIDDRAQRSAQFVAQLASFGILTAEIARFFRDEVVRRFKSAQDKKALLHERSIPFTNWILKNRFPVDLIDFPERAVSFAERAHAETRVTDVYWQFVQNIALVAYPDEAYENDTHSDSWSSGPVVLAWPSSTAFLNLFSRLSERGHVNEAGRMATFNRIDFSGQLLTDVSFGTVTFTEDKLGRPSPESWLRLEARGSRFVHAAFYESYFLSADFRLSKFENSNFNGARLPNVNLDSAQFVDCSFAESDMTNISARNCSFYECRFESVDIWESVFSGAKFHECHFSPVSDFRDTKRRTTISKIERTEFNGTAFSRTIISKSIWKNCSFKAATFVNCDLSKADMVRNRFGDVVFEKSALAAKLSQRLYVESADPEELPATL